MSDKTITTAGKLTTEDLGKEITFAKKEGGIKAVRTAHLHSVAHNFNETAITVGSTYKSGEASRFNLKSDAEVQPGPKADT